MIGGDRPIVKQVMKGDNFKLVYVFKDTPVRVDWRSEKAFCVLKNNVVVGREASISGYCETDFPCLVTGTAYMPNGNIDSVNYVIQAKFADDRQRSQLLLATEGINEYNLLCEDGQPLAYENRYTN